MANNPHADRPASSGLLSRLGSVQVPGWAAAVMSVGLVAIIGLAFWMLREQNPAAPAGAAAVQTQFSSEADPDATEVEVLPQTIRSFDGGEVKNPFASASLGEVRVVGVMTNSNGKGTAIIEAAGASYIVSTGDSLPDSPWTIKSVGANSVTFSNQGSEKTIFMDSQNVAEVG